MKFDIESLAERRDCVGHGAPTAAWVLTPCGMVGPCRDRLSLAEAGGDAGRSTRLGAPRPDANVACDVNVPVRLIRSSATSGSLKQGVVWLG